MYAQIVLFDGFDPLDVVGPFEVLVAGQMLSGGKIHSELVSAEGPRDVASGMGALTLRATAALDPALADIVIVPGASGPLEGADDAENPSIPELLAGTLDTKLPVLMEQALADPTVLVSTVCGGSLALAMAGLLEGRHAVTHHLGMDVLAATGVHAVHARVVDDGDLVSAGGVTSGLDLALYLLDRELGPRIARSVEHLLDYERRGTTWRNTGLAPLTVGPSATGEDAA